MEAQGPSTADQEKSRFEHEVRVGADRLAGLGEREIFQRMIWNLNVIMDAESSHL